MTAMAQPEPSLVAVIVAAIAAFEGRPPETLRVAAVVPSPWALAGRLEQTRRAGRR